MPRVEQVSSGIHPGVNNRIEKSPVSRIEGAIVIVPPLVDERYDAEVSGKEKTVLKGPPVMVEKEPREGT